MPEKTPTDRQTGGQYDNFLWESVSHLYCWYIGLGSGSMQLNHYHCDEVWSLRHHM